jgi:hypothetical protein
MKDMHVEILTLLKAAHLLALAAALGPALAADALLVLRGVLRPITAMTIEMARFLSQFVMVGLVALWVTGIPLALQVHQVTPEFFTNEKFWVKVFIVAVLSLNGLVIHGFVLPLVADQRGRRLLDGLGTRRRLALAAAGGVSFVSWMFPLVLGVAKELSYVVPASQLLEAYGVALAGGVSGFSILALMAGRAATGVAYEAGHL